MARFIRRVRKHVRLSQVELADLLGVRQSAISQWERGATQPDGAHLFDLLLKLAPASITVLTDIALPADTEQAPPPPRPSSP